MVDKMNEMEFDDDRVLGVQKVGLLLTYSVTLRLVPMMSSRSLAFDCSCVAG